MSPSSPAATQAPAGGNRTGEAVHKDLYKHAADPAAEQARLREEARTLGVGFFVFFSLIIGGLSLTMNGLLTRGFVVTVAAPGALKDEAQVEALRDIAETRGAVWTLGWSNGQRTNVAVVDVAERDEDDPKPADLQHLTRVRVQARDADGRTAPLAALWSTTIVGQRVVSLDMEGAPAAALPSAAHALRNAKLLRTVPTHCVVSIGAVLGLLGVLVPGLLIPFYKFWMRFVAAPLGWFNTRLILGVVFFIMFTPMALALWVRRQLKPETDALDRADRPGSYWKTRAQRRPAKHFERTF